MTVRILALALMLVFIVGCPAKKPKPDESAASAGNSGTVDDKSIQKKDMAFDATGSDSGQIEGLYTIHFPYDKSTLTEKDRGLLAKDAQWIKAHQGTTVQIEGHCDRHGSQEYNLALGERRAKAVQSYLENMGVDKDSLTIISYGKEKMLDSAETDAADGKNRRANFVPQNSQ